MRWWTSLFAMLFLISLCGCNQTPVDDDDNDDNDASGDDDSADDDDDDVADDDATDDDDDDATTDDDDDATAGGPHLVVVPAQLNYGILCVGQPDTIQVRLVNDGTQALNVTGMTHNVPPVNFTEFVGPIAPQEEEIVPFTAGCGGENSFTGEVHIFSNDPGTPDKTIPIILDCDEC
jgi:hypothetical protein